MQIIVFLFNFHISEVLFGPIYCKSALVQVTI